MGAIQEASPFGEARGNTSGFGVYWAIAVRSANATR